jgi:predicted RNA-binding protein
MKQISISIPHQLASGICYLDVIIIGQTGELNKIRKILGDQSLIANLLSKLKVAEHQRRKLRT